ILPPPPPPPQEKKIAIGDERILEFGETKFIKGSRSNEDLLQVADFTRLYLDSPMPDNLKLDNILLYITRQTLSRILLMDELYKKFIDVQGIICEFGVFYGANLALYEAFRGLYEPYNITRKIVGFDTFEGFPNINKKDGESEIVQKGAYSTTKGYEEYLEQVLLYHEKQSPVSHKKKFELIKGDATKTVKEYFNKYPETIVAFAYFDFDLYEPTKECLETIIPHLSKGAIIGFDELNHHEFPGETRAFDEVLGLNKQVIHRSRTNPYTSYILYE
ncbi:MAG: class I SAM-dependent methyltransferase, partial [Dysgonamonadaceae bacterium]|nr:class I SAM-dependent methyltransferase [Dysgonamonadaceae bacterium]